MMIQGSYPSYKIHLEEMTAPIVGTILLKAERDNLLRTTAARWSASQCQLIQNSQGSATAQFGK